jgi:hypothetical protein
VRGVPLLEDQPPFGERPGLGDEGEHLAVAAHLRHRLAPPGGIVAQPVLAALEAHEIG